MTFVRRMPLRRFFLKTRILGPRVSPSTTADDARVGDKRRAGEHFAAVFLDEQHLLERQFGARLAGRAVDGRETAGRHAHLTSAGLDDCVHCRASVYACKTLIVARSRRRCKELRANELERGRCRRLLQQDAGALDFLAAQRAQEVRHERSISSKYDDSAGVFCCAL